MKLRWSVLLVAAACSRNAPNGPSAVPSATTATSNAPPAESVAHAAAIHADPHASPGPFQLIRKELPLPGAHGPAFLDYIVCERASARVWIPVGSTGSVDLLDAAAGTFKRIDGFATEEREMRGAKRTYGPSAATLGDGIAYIGNRATSEICPIDLETLKPSKCIKLATPTDGVVYVASAKEVWVTTPKDQTLTVLDASKPGALTAKTTVRTDGEPEGYAVDEARGLFFTNLEDKGPTVVIDVKTHKIKATWNAGCGADGPRGLAFDPVHDFVIVACTDHVQVLDAAHDGTLLGKLDTGTGVDNIDLVDGKLYVAAGKAAKLTVASVDDKGQLAVIAVGHTSEGARNAVADAKGNVYVGDSLGARLLVFAAPPSK